MELKDKQWLIYGAIPKISETRLTVPIEIQEEPSYDLTIKGALVADEATAEELSYWGVETDSYERIARIAATFDGPKKIFVDCPGGQVHANVELAAKALAKHKHTFVVNTCCSAAYWLACSGEIIANSSLSFIGSIGVITEYNKDLEDEWKSVRSTESPEKAVRVNEDEDYYIKNNIDPVYNAFKAWVSSNRDLPEEAYNGQACYPEKALSLNFIDSIQEDYMSKELEAQIEALKAEKEELEKQSAEKLAKAEEAVANAKADAEAKVKAEEVKYMTAKELSGNNADLEKILMSVENLTENKDIFSNIIKAVQKEKKEIVVEKSVAKAETKNVVEAKAGIKVNRNYGAK